jgi:hypothetical protein
MGVKLKGISEVDGRTVEILSEDLGSGGGGGGSVGQQFYVEVPITPAEFYNMPVTPKTIVPAQAGKSIFFSSFNLLYKVATPFNPASQNLVDMPAGGSMLYWAPKLDTVGSFAVCGINAGGINLGSVAVGAPLQIQLQTPFTAGALSEDALVMAWWFAV